MTTARLRLLLGAGLVVALLLAGAVSYYASSKPDGLERVATDQGFADQADEHAQADSPLADYGTKGVENDRLSGGMAGVIGTLAVLVLAGGLAYLVRARSRRSTNGPPTGATAGPPTSRPSSHHHAAAD